MPRALLAASQHPISPGPGGTDTGRSILLGQAWTPHPSTCSPGNTKPGPILPLLAPLPAVHNEGKANPKWVPSSTRLVPVIFSPPRTGTSDNAALCENRGQEETRSIASTTSRILTLSLPSGCFLAWRQRERRAQHPVPTSGWVLLLPAAQSIVPMQHWEGRGW